MRTTTRISIAGPTRWPPARRTPTSRRGRRCRHFIGAARAKEIIFVRGTTEGINLVAQTYGRKFLQPGDEIVLSTLEHHANIVPWQMIAKEKGAVLRVIPVTDRGEVMLEQYQALLGPRTRIVSLSHASNALGTVLPVAEMTQMAKRYNARVLIDGGAVDRPYAGERAAVRIATFSSFPGTRFSRPRASARFTPRKSCWKSCRRGRAAAA